MLVFITNTPRAYAWGSRDALPAILREPPTGEPQAELWLGDHAGAPAMMAKGSREATSLIDLISSDPEAYGVDGGKLPYLMKVLGIGAPLSIQVHPDANQAGHGFARENAAGITLDAFARSYKDANHKPEIVVALTQIRALCGFRSITDVRADISALTAQAGTCGARGSQALYALAVKVGQVGHLSNGEKSDAGEAFRDDFLAWAFSGDPAVTTTVEALTEVLHAGRVAGLDPLREEVLRLLLESYPNDPGVLVSLLTHVVELNPGEAQFLPPRRIHAYLSGVGVEVMASSDNVLRAGLTEKHVDVDELRRVVDLGESTASKFAPSRSVPGLTSWQPPVPDFALHRVLLAPQGDYDDEPPEGSAESLTFGAPYPTVMIVTAGSIRVERDDAGSSEVARVRQGQSLYISAGSDLTLTGSGEAFIASVGESWGSY